MYLSREKLIRYRERFGYSQTMLGERAGVHRDTIVNAERGDNVRPTTSFKIATVLGVPVAELIREPEE